MWERAEPASRPAPSPLSRERIVDAAITIADRDGLAAVTLRSVAAALDAGPMRLYGYLATKDELIALMADAVYGEVVMAGPVPGAWRDALRTIAHRTRDATRRHPWFVELLGGRPQIGPNALAHLEASLAAVAGAPGGPGVVGAGGSDIDAVMQAVGTVNAYVIGAVRSEASEWRAELESGLEEPAWQTATGPYLARMVATGRFPTVARVIRDATHPPPDVVFDRGLESVLDGIAARLAR